MDFKTAELIPHVLLIEDDPAIRSLFENILFNNNIRIDCASRISEAAEKLNRHMYTVIISDFELTDGTGEEVIDFIIKKKIITPTCIYSGSAISNELKNRIFAFINKTGPVSGVLETIQKAHIEYLQRNRRNEPRISYRMYEKEIETMIRETKFTASILDESSSGKKIFLRPPNVLSLAADSLLIAGENKPYQKIWQRKNGQGWQLGIRKKKE
ncbi:MAG: hypothetical protein A2096_17065 [Spirochaetes bacterium GWF1_41_5]|nr:MAG: hypothetical protein A2096_17065 [Spirochaetes bacterium GWF1_41_5]HBE00977.1 hypothetical protein [Spirochaetia bacterium]